MFDPTKLLRSFGVPNIFSILIIHEPVDNMNGDLLPFVWSHCLIHFSENICVTHTHTHTYCEASTEGSQDDGDSSEKCLSSHI